jgi:hypothetical protein
MTTPIDYAALTSRWKGKPLGEYARDVIGVTVSDDAKMINGVEASGDIVSITGQDHNDERIVTYTAASGGLKLIRFETTATRLMVAAEVKAPQGLELFYWPTTTTLLREHVIKAAENHMNLAHARERNDPSAEIFAIRAASFAELLKIADERPGLFNLRLFDLCWELCCCTHETATSAIKCKAIAASAIELCRAQGLN